jgi:hypothetical protein
MNKIDIEKLLKILKKSNPTKDRCPYHYVGAEIEIKENNYNKSERPSIEIHNEIQKIIPDLFHQILSFLYDNDISINPYDGTWQLECIIRPTERDGKIIPKRFDCISILRNLKK